MSEPCRTAPQSFRSRLEQALDGEPVTWPVYGVYNWYVENRDLDWPRLFELGLGRLNHATVVDEEHPNVQIVETVRECDGEHIRTVRWITDIGELQETFRGEWRYEHLLKTPEDYRIMKRALEGTRYTPNAERFWQSEEQIGAGGFTFGQLGRWPLRRTPIMDLQADWAGIERVALDLADELPPLMELLELMDELVLDKCRAAARSPARYIKLWENLSIETVGPYQFRERIVPLYRKIIDVLGAAGKRLVVHFDGKLRPALDDIAGLDMDIDSLTEPPEGDLSIAEARAAWPDKFLWLTPSSNLFRQDRSVLAEEIRRMARQAGSRFCFLISEEIPAHWEQTIPAVLETLHSLDESEV